jgi:hypothetical protein
VSAPRPEILEYVAHALPGATLEPLAQDASTRRFFRVRPRSGPTRILMDYGSAFEGETADVVLGRIFTTAGLPVAQTLDVASRAGCLLQEDLGDRTLEQELLSCGSRSRLLLEAAVRLAAAIARDGSVALARSARAAGPALDAERFRFEMDYFLEHYACGLRGRTQVPDSLRAGLHELADRAAETPRRVLCHRDFHSRNLLVRDDDELALVDIQDARWGPDGYDLASLLRDAYIDVDEAWIDPLVDLYLEASCAPAREEFRRRFDVIACQRMLKALGTFGALRSSAGAARYLDGIPRTLARLRRLLPARSETQSLGTLLSATGLLE